MKFHTPKPNVRFVASLFESWCCWGGTQLSPPKYPHQPRGSAVFACKYASMHGCPWLLSLSLLSLFSFFFFFFSFLSFFRVSEES